jgi:hypothetical protein
MILKKDPCFTARSGVMQSSAVSGVLFLLLLGCVSKETTYESGAVGHRICGRVTDAAGSPLAHASVELIWDRLIVGPGFIVRGKSSYPRREADHAVSMSETDERGSFSLYAPAALARLRPRNCMLLIRHAGFGATVVRNSLEAALPLKIRMQKEGVIRGKITDEKSNPIAGVEVALIGDLVERVRTHADSYGQFELHEIDFGHPRYALHVRRGEHDIGIWSPPISEIGADYPVTLVLPHGATKYLSLNDSRGEPIACAKVTISSKSMNSETVRWSEFLTDAQGNLIVDGIDGAEFTVQCQGETHRIRESVDRVTLSMRSICGVILDVVDHATGEAIDEFFIYEPLLPARCYWIKTTEGSSKIVYFKLGRYELCIERAGYKVWRGTIEIEGSTEKIDIRMEKI